MPGVTQPNRTAPGPRPGLSPMPAPPVCPWASPRPPRRGRVCLCWSLCCPRGQSLSLRPSVCCHYLCFSVLLSFSPVCVSFSLSLRVRLFFRLFWYLRVSGCLSFHLLFCVCFSPRLSVSPGSLMSAPHPGSHPQQQPLSLLPLPLFPGAAEPRPCPLLPAGANPLKRSQQQRKASAHPGSLVSTEKPRPGAAGHGAVGPTR